MEKKIFDLEKKFSGAKKIWKKRSISAQKTKKVGFRADILEKFSEIFRKTLSVYDALDFVFEDLRFDGRVTKEIWLNGSE